MKYCEIKGIIPPILTPMNNDDEQTVNHAELRNQVERLLAGGVHGLFPFGTNGEGYILSLKEKEEILETVIDQVRGRVPVYAGTGCISTADTIRMSKRAEELGADVLSIITPSFALASQKELYDHYVAVAKAVNIPIVLYNIPPRTGNKLLPETVRALCKDVDVIMGAKDSSGDIENLKAYIRMTEDLPKKVAILAGNDGAILTGLKAGGAGGIAGRANLYPKTVADIYNKFAAGDLEGAQANQDAISGIQRVFKFGNPNTVIKKAVALMGYPVGDCRRPFNYLCDEGIAELKQVLRENEEKGLC
ncbi:MAG: dihydrodipicolinate synthase family protein [Faecousia sp.]